MKTVIIDFDDTLLNTTALKKALAQSLGLSEEQWSDAYRRYVEDNNTFDAAGFLQGVDAAKRKKFEQVLQRTQTFMYPDSRQFINQCLESGWRVVILTYGDVRLQTAKLDAVDWPEAVERRVVDVRKVNVLSEYISDTTVIIDDKPAELDLIAEQFPAVSLYWMKRATGAHRDTEPKRYDTMVTDLSIIL